MFVTIAFYSAIKKFINLKFKTKYTSPEKLAHQQKLPMTKI